MRPREFTVLSRLDVAQVLQGRRCVPLNIQDRIKRRTGFFRCRLSEWAQNFRWESNSKEVTSRLSSYFRIQTRLFSFLVKLKSQSAKRLVQARMENPPISFSTSLQVLKRNLHSHSRNSRANRCRNMPGTFAANRRRNFNCGRWRNTKRKGEH